MSFTENLIELRKRLIYSLILFIISFLFLFPFANKLYLILAYPLLKLLGSNAHLVATDVTSPFLVPLKVTLWCAFGLSLPHTLYQFWKFIAPALFKTERILVSFIVVLSLILFILGVCFCFFVMLPSFFYFMNNFKSPYITMMTDINGYLNFSLRLFLIFGICFQLPIVIFLLIQTNVLTYQKIKQLRAYIFVACFIIAALVTPPDVLSQTMLAIPLYTLCEIGILGSGLVNKIKSTSKNTHNNYGQT